VQLFQDQRAERRRIDVDVGWDHLDGIEVEIASAKQCQHFLGDADTVDEADVDTHGFRAFWTAEAGSMPCHGSKL